MPSSKEKDRPLRYVQADSDASALTFELLKISSNEIRRISAGNLLQILVVDSEIKNCGKYRINHIYKNN